MCSSVSKLESLRGQIVEFLANYTTIKEILHPYTKRKFLVRVRGVDVFCGAFDHTAIGYGG